MIVDRSVVALRGDNGGPRGSEVEEDLGNRTSLATGDVESGDGLCLELGAMRAQSILGVELGPAPAICGPRLLQLIAQYVPHITTICLRLVGEIPTRTLMIVQMPTGAVVLAT